MVKEAAKLILNNVSKSIFKEENLIMTGSTHKTFLSNTIQPLSVYIDPDRVKLILVLKIAEPLF
jgi:hypothetical protein